jgi:hypothetical protein
VVRATLATWYRDLVTALHQDVCRRAGATLRESGTFH